MNSETKVAYVGIDAGKAELVCQTPDLLLTVANEREAVFARLREWRKRYPKLHLVIEPTGGQERLLLAAAAALQIPATRVNARQVRDFARGLGWLEKSDRIDAGVLRRYGETARPAPTGQPTAVQEKLRELVQLRDHYVAQLQHEQTYQQSLQGAGARQLAQAHAAQLEATVTAVERELEALLDTEAPEPHVPVQTLCLVKGVGVAPIVGQQRPPAPEAATSSTDAPPRPSDRLSCRRFEARALGRLPDGARLHWSRR